MAGHEAKGLRLSSTTSVIGSRDAACQHNEAMEQFLGTSEHVDLGVSTDEAWFRFMDLGVSSCMLRAYGKQMAGKGSLLRYSK